MTLYFTGYIDYFTYLFFTNCYTRNTMSIIIRLNTYLEIFYQLLWDQQYYPLNLIMLHIWFGFFGEIWRQLMDIVDMNSRGLLIECFRWVHQVNIIITTIVTTTERTDHYSHSGIVYVVQIFLIKKERVLKSNEIECFV